jgi:hypothetical protein
VSRVYSVPNLNSVFKSIYLDYAVDMIKLLKFSPIITHVRKYTRYYIIDIPKYKLCYD